MSKDEFEQLEQNILAEQKIRDPLVLWNGVLVDGHNRYKIAKKHGLDYLTENIEFKDEQEAKIWIIDNQLGRRNLPPYARIELAKMKEPAIREEAEKRMLAGKVDPTQKSAEGSGETRQQIAALAGVSHDTLRKATVISELAPLEVLQELREGKTKINTVYNDVVEPRRISITEISLGVINKRPSTKADKDEQRKTDEQVKRIAEYSRNHKKTIEEFRMTFRANLENNLDLLADHFFSTASHLWSDESNKQTAYALIDEAIEATKKLKDRFNAKLKARQNDSPADENL